MKKSDVLYGIPVICAVKNFNEGIISRLEIIFALCLYTALSVLVLSLQDMSKKQVLEVVFIIGFISYSMAFQEDGLAKREIIYKRIILSIFGLLSSLPFMLRWLADECVWYLLSSLLCMFFFISRVIMELRRNRAHTT